MLAAGTVLQDRYRTVRIIGHGGMGAVYEAVDLRLGSTVALKQTLFNDDELSRAFQREAHLLAALRHPALPRVSDHFVECDGQFLVMEFIPGDDLGRLLKVNGRPFECGKVLDWAYQLLDALEYQHLHRPPVIHRDIKPQNLKLTTGGQIILLDFGLAKGEPHLLDPTTATSVFGYTLNFAPLEQIQHKGTDARSDLYSAGATLYQLMTAVVPPGSLSRAAAIVSGEGDPLLPASAVNPEVSSEIAQILSRAMALRANQRFESASAMRRTLGEASWRPSTGHPIFGRVATTATRTVAWSAGATLKAGLDTDLYEAPTLPLVVTERNVDLQTVPIRPRTDTESGESSPGKRTVSIWLLAATVTLLFFLSVFWSARLGKSDPLPPVVSKQEPAPPNANGNDRPDGVVPRDMVPPYGPQMVLPTFPPIVVNPPANSIALDEVIWNADGTVTLHWLPVFGAVKYRLEIADDDLTKIRVLTETEDSIRTVPVPRSDATRYVRLTAIFKGGREIVGRWFPLTRDSAPHAP